MGSLEDFLFKASLGYFQHIVDKGKSAGTDGDGPSPVRDSALLRLKNKAGAVTVLLGTRETGKCLSKSTPLQLADGRVILAGDCKAGDTVLAMGEDLKIRPTPVLLTADMGLQRCLKTKLRSGRSIVSTPEHPFYTIDGWVKIEDISIGGRVAVARYLPIEGTVDIDSAYPRLLGLLIGDGSICDKSPRFTNSNPIISQDFMSATSQIPGAIAVAYTVKTRSPSFGIKGTKFPHNPVVIWLKEIGLWGHRSYTKFIPNCVYTWRNDMVALFINRLFATDGYVSKQDIQYSSVSETLIDQLQSLLLRFDVQSKKKSKTTKCNGRRFKSFYLTIDGKDSKRSFIDKIGILGKEIPLLALSERMGGQAANPSTDTIPMEVWNKLQISPNRWVEGLHWADIGMALGQRIPKNFRSSIAYCPSRAKLLVVSNVAHNKELNDLATSDIYWDEIVSKEEVAAEVCDLMTEEHNFIANDIVAHNTTLSYVVAKMLGRPTYAISPQQTPPPWITPITLSQIWTKLPSRCTLILDDMPAYASNRDYTNELVKNLERLVPMVRHEPHPPEWPVGEIQLIFSSQSAAQADKYMLDCDCVFFKPLGLLYEDYERQNIKRIYRDYVNAYFNEKSHDWILHHAWMRTPEYNGGIYYNRVTAPPVLDPAFQPSHP